MSAALLIEQLTVQLGARMALADINMSVAPGRRVALLGANGAGKSTLLRAIAGHIDSNALRGRIEIGGAPAGSRRARARLGIIPQRLSLFRRLTARENLVAFARLHGLTHNAAKDGASRQLQALGLGTRSDEPVTQLSAGMQRRVSVACGTVHSPAILLADEPTVGIDVAHREAVERLLQTARERGCTVIESTHDLARIGDRFDEVVVLDAGRVVAQGTADEVVGDLRRFGHTCRLRLSTPLSESPPPEFAIEGDTLVGSLGDVAQLGGLLASLRAQGLQIVDLSVAPPGVDDLLRVLHREGAR